MTDDGIYHHLGWRRIYRDPDGHAHFERIDDGTETLSFLAAERTRVILDAMVQRNAELERWDDEYAHVPLPDVGHMQLDADGC